jgi:hypothetical protein
MTAEGQVATVAHAAEDAAGELMNVFADYIAPIIGLVVGWVLAGVIGGLATIGNFVYNAVGKVSGANATKIADLSAAGVMGGISAIAGGAFWSASSGKSVKSLKSWGSAIAKGLLRFMAGVGFGAAICYVVNGVSGNFSEGWIDTMGSSITKEVA